MYLGRIVEIGDDRRPSGPDPRHPYTEALVAAIPRADGAGVLPVDLPGDVPDPASPPSGCRFHPRCPIAADSCADTRPAAGHQWPAASRLPLRSGAVAHARQPHAG